jgi:hypothetical protein
MPSDPRLASALRLAQAIARMRMADDWQVETVGATEDDGEGRGDFYLTITLRWMEAASEDPEELRRHIL